KTCFHRDDFATADDAYTDEAFAAIAASGFNAVWLRGRLRQLMDSTVFPELNDPGAARRRDVLRRIIARGERHGVRVFLFFNEPLALFVDDPFWRTHQELMGQPHRDFGEDRGCVSLCTSHPEVRRFMRQAI